MNGSKNGAIRLLDRFKKPEAMKPPEQLPGVAICVPSGDMVHADFAASLVGVIAWCAMLQPGWATVPFAFVNCKGSLVVRNRNQLVDNAKQLGAQYILFLDSDMTFPTHTLRRLLSHEKDIVGCTYLQREEPHRLLGVWKEGLVLTTDKLHQVNALPLGCMLVKMSVFEEMAKPYFRTPAIEKDELGEARIQGEDYYFCDQAERLGFDVWLDVGLSMEVSHIGQQRIKLQATPQEPPAEAAKEGAAAAAAAALGEPNG